MAIREVGSRGLLLTQSELVCWRVFRAYQRHQLVADILAWGSVFWPPFLRRVQWSQSLLLRIVQILLLLAVWPLFFLAGLLQMLITWLWFPVRLLTTFFTPKALQAPGEKSLLGLHNAFVSASITSVVLSERLYVACINEWVAQLYGAEVALQKNLSRYIELLENERKDLGMEANLGASLRNEVVVARERLSRDLGHYLVDAEESSARRC